MNKETLKYFFKGLQAYIKDNKLGQGKVAKRAGTTGITMSRYIAGRGFPAQKWITSVTDALGVNEGDLVALGKGLSGNDKHVSKEVHPTSKEKEGISGDEPHVGYMKIIASVGNFVDKQQEYADRMHFWIEMFSLLPIPALIVREGFVIYQNEISYKMGDISGRPISGADVENGELAFNGITYKTNASCPRWNSMAYMIITFGEVV